MTSGQRPVLLVLTLFFPLLPLVRALAFFWLQDTHPQRARSFGRAGQTFLQAVLLVVLAVAAFQFLAAWV